MSGRKIAGGLGIVLGFIVLTFTGIRTISSPEIFTHIALGQNSSGISYSMDESAWVPMVPLYDRLVSALWSGGGATAITLTHVLIVLAAFLLMYRFGREWGGPLSRAFALLLCSRLLLPVFNPGPYVFFMLFTALFLILLYKVKSFPLKAGALLVLQVLWTQLHPSFLFGPVLILFCAIENYGISSGRRGTAVNPMAPQLFVLSLVALLATLVNPSTINLHRHLIENWSVLTGTENIEWISLYSGFFEQRWIGRITVFTLILGACGLVTLQKTLPPMITFLALVGAFLTVRSVAMLHLFAFLALPFLTLSFNAVGEQIGRAIAPFLKTRPAVLHGAMTFVALLLLLLSLGSLVTNRGYARIGSASVFGLGLQQDAFPYAAEGILQRDDFPTRMVNIAHDGGYIAARIPGKKIFCDTRASFYGSAFHRTLNQALLGQEAAWKTILAEWNPHAVVLNASWPDSGALANRLIASRAWKLVYFDGSTVILVRNLPQYASLINDPSIQKYGLRVLEQSRRDYMQRGGGFIKAGNPSRLIGAGGMYLALNRPIEAEAIYSLLTRYNPDMAGAWLGLGQSKILQRKLSLGIEHMEQAARITPQSGRIWISLLEAYRMRGDTQKAMDAMEKLNRFFKADRATVEQQQTATHQRPSPQRPDQRRETPELPSELKPR